MAQKNDISIIIKNFASIKIKHIIVICLIIIILYSLHVISNMQLSGKIDKIDYKAVAENFITSNPTVAQIIGKVISISHYGNGGGAGQKSHNVYTVKGEDKTGVFYISLSKDSDGLWYVESALLMEGGHEYMISVKGSGKGRGVRFLE